MRIAFHSNQLGLRGTEVALFDYAHFNETLLGHESFIVSKGTHFIPHHPAVIQKFQARFRGRVAFYPDMGALEKFLEAHRIDILYTMKSGERDEVISPGRKTVVHCVFQHFDPHGTVYAYISEWLALRMTQGRYPFVPYMIDLPTVAGDLRHSLGIPPNAVVFGRHGGMETFDLPFVQQAIVETVRARNNIYFLLPNTNKFYSHPQILHPPAMMEARDKVRFIQSCDAMIHARQRGESFGLAIAEFSIKNKPVLTWDGGEDQAHLALLGDKAIKYRNYQEVYHLLNHFLPDRSVNYDCYSEKFSPAAVMKKFKEIFIDG